jgi:hypothetical protein
MAVNRTGELVPLSPTWSKDGLILLLPKTRLPWSIEVAGICGVTGAVLVEFLPSVGMCLLAIAAVAALPVRHSQSAIRLHNRAIELKGTWIQREQITNVSVEAVKAGSIVTVSTRHGSSSLTLEGDEMLGRAVARLVRAWAHPKRPSTWGGPAYFESLHAHAFDEDAMDAMASFSPKSSADGLSLTFVAPSTHRTVAAVCVGVCMVGLAAVLFASPLTTIPGLDLFVVHLDPLGLLIATLFACGILAATVQFFVHFPGEPTLDLSMTGVRSGDFRCSYADLGAMRLRQGRLTIKSKKGKLTLYHPDSDALFELRERLLALRNHARSHARGAEQAALRKLLHTSARQRGGDRN